MALALFAWAQLAESDANHYLGEAARWPRWSADVFLTQATAARVVASKDAALGTD